MERLYRGTVKQRETVGKIMESIVLLKYPLETESITFNDLLEWELWPSFIKIFSELLYSIMHALVYSYIIHQVCFFIIFVAKFVLKSIANVHLLKT